MIMFVNTTNKGNLNMRAEPSLTAKVLAQIPYGTKLEIIHTTNDWSEIEYNGLKGYVMNKFLKESSNISKEDLKRIYNSLQQTLKTIEGVLK